MKVSKNKKIILIAAGIVFCFVIIFVSWGAGVSNSAISQEENIVEARSAIGNAEVVRTQKISALINGIESYSGIEQQTVATILDTIEKAMQTGDYDDINVQVNALYAIPEIKVVALYQQFGNEYAIEANKLRGYYEDHNLKVARYNAHYRKFPNGMFLAMFGTQKQDFELYQLPQVVTIDVYNPFG